MRLSTVLVLVPLVLVAAIIAVANRMTVTFSLDPFSAAPVLAYSMPLFLLVFIVFLAGIVVGGIAVALNRGRRARTAPPPARGPDASTLESDRAGHDSPPA